MINPPSENTTLFPDSRDSRPQNGFHIAHGVLAEIEIRQILFPELIHPLTPEVRVRPEYADERFHALYRERQRDKQHTEQRRERHERREH